MDDLIATTYTLPVCEDDPMDYEAHLVKDLKWYREHHPAMPDGFWIFMEEYSKGMITDKQIRNRTKKYLRKEHGKQHGETHSFKHSRGRRQTGR